MGEKQQNNSAHGGAMLFLRQHSDVAEEYNELA